MNQAQSSEAVCDLEGFDGIFFGERRTRVGHGCGNLRYIVNM
jgi:hypothetical protein